MTLTRAAYLLYFLFWLIFAMCSSFRDWDLGYTLLEIDLRALMENFRLPTWSYQYCGGLTRSGDVNSQAESPWFILPLVFGSYWGVKLLAPVGMTTSVYFLNRFLEKILGWSFKDAMIFSVLFSLNGFWLLHFVHGHVGYSSQFLFIDACLFFYAYFLNGDKKELLIAAFLYFLAFTLGFYQVATYMGFPAFISAAAGLAYLFFSGRRKEIKWIRLHQISGTVLFVSLLYSHKIYSAMKYQSMFPRVVDSEKESYGFSQLFYSLFIPAKDTINPFGFYGFSERWMIHEFSYFSLLNLVAIMAAIVFLSKRKWPVWKEMPLSLVIGIFGIIISILFYLGSFIPVAPFALVNKYFFSNSHRVSPRYLLWGEFFICIVTYQLIRNHFQGLRFKLITGAIVAVSLVQLGLIFSEEGLLDRAKVEYKMNSDEVFYSPEMKFVSFTTFEYPRATYFLLIKNLAVLNCYTPLSHPATFDLKLVANVPKLFHPYFFLSHLDGSEINAGTSCFENSYFTQTEIHIDDSCPDEMRLRLSALNPEKPIANFDTHINEQGIFLKKRGSP